MQLQATPELIDRFLTGSAEPGHQRITQIEASRFTNKVILFYQHEDNTKSHRIDSYTPFIYMRHPNKLPLKINKDAKNNRLKQQYGISVEALQTHREDKDGNPVHEQRLLEGYKYIVKSTRSLQSIISYFKAHGVNVYGNGEDGQRLFLQVRPDEQYMIEKRVRLFRGMERYKDLHKLVFDIETTGLDPEKDRVFLIGMRDNFGFEKVLEVEKVDDDFYEEYIIRMFFHEVARLEPSLIAGYNSENFDFHFLLRRLAILTQVDNINDHESNPVPVVRQRALDHFEPGRKPKFNRKPTSLKLGGETEEYEKTQMWGYSVIDIQHAVRRAKAINSEIKKTGLKYICQFQGIAKPNRMYVPGDKIYSIWQGNRDYIINRVNNKYHIIPEEYQGKAEQYLSIYREQAGAGEEPEPNLGLERENLSSLEVTSGKDIVFQYLLDDLWETEQVDEAFNQDSFLLGKMTPTNFERKNTMGNASVWNLLMTAWSYENGLAIPVCTKKRDFVGGLSRVFWAGFAERIQKLDFAGLYPSIQLTWDVFPSADVSGAIKAILTYVKLKRDEYKKMAGDKSLDKNQRIFYKTLQLPLKILTNATFGSLGSEYFNWADMDVAERITCTGRQYLRSMVFFFAQYGCKPIILDTDGCNFIVPPMVSVDIDLIPLSEPMPVDELVYRPEPGVEIKGVAAIVEKYNREVMGTSGLDRRFMKLDDDGQWVSCINISKKNYANLEEDGKIKYTGNTIKSSTLPEYVEEFLDKGMKMILRNDAVGFIEYYYEYLDKIANCEIPLKKIATRTKIKKNIQDYLFRGLNTAGKKLPKQANMELVFQDYVPDDLKEKINPLVDEYYEIIMSGGDAQRAKTIRQEVKSLLSHTNIPFDLGDVVYYVNTGTSKSHSDSKIGPDGKLLSGMIKADDLEYNPNMLGEYNVARYVSIFNKRVEKILIVFKKEIRDFIIKDVITHKDRKTKEVRFSLPEREYFSKQELEMSLEPVDTVDELMTMDPREVTFWNDRKLDPRVIFKYFNHADPIWCQPEPVLSAPKQAAPSAVAIDDEQAAVPIEEAGTDSVKSASAGVAENEIADQEFEEVFERMQMLIKQQGGQEVTVRRSAGEIEDVDNEFFIKKEAGEYFMYTLTKLRNEQLKSKLPLPMLFPERYPQAG